MYVASCPATVVWTGSVAVVFGTSPSAFARSSTVDPTFGLRSWWAHGSSKVLSTVLTTKAIPAGGADVPRFAPNSNGSQSGGSSTLSSRAEPFTSLPATVTLAVCWLRLESGDGATAEDGATVAGATGDEEATVADGATAGDGATAAGPQAMPATTAAAAANAILSVLFTDEPSAPTSRGDAMGSWQLISTAPSAEPPAHPALPPGMSPIHPRSFHLFGAPRSSIERWNDFVAARLMMGERGRWARHEPGARCSETSSFAPGTATTTPSRRSPRTRSIGCIERRG